MVMETLASIEKQVHEQEKVIAERQAKDKAEIDKMRGEFDKMKKAGVQPGAMKELERRLKEKEDYSSGVVRTMTEYLSTLRGKLASGKAELERQAGAAIDAAQRNGDRERQAYKLKAQQAFIASGGTYQEFEEVFSRLWQDELVRRTQANLERKDYFQPEL